MARCVGKKADGTPCERIVGESNRFCFAHDPTKVEARKRSAAKAGKVGGRGRPKATPDETLEQIDQTLITMVAGMITPDEQRRISTKVASVVAQICNCRIRVVEVSRRLYETREL